MNPRECLQQARELIAALGRWTTGAYARDASGQHISYTDDNAVAWCGAGAILMVIYKNRLSYDLSEPVRKACKQLYGITNTTRVNDGLGHAAVLAAFDIAIAAETQS